MKKCVLVAIRYSILFGSKTKGFHLSSSQDNDTDYREVLFSEERMALRENLFNNFTIPSLKSVFENSGSDMCFRVVVMTSSELPEKNKEFLFNVEKENYDWLSVQFIEPNNVDYGKAMWNSISDIDGDQEFIFATARLDDDDALHSDYCNYLSDLMNEENDKNVVTFSCGYNVFVVGGGNEVVGAAVHRHLKNSAGLAYIRRYRKSTEIIQDNIYTCGNHAKIDDNFNLINVENCYSYVRVNTETSDRMYTLSPEERRKRVFIEFKRQDNKVPFREVVDKFSINFELNGECSTYTQ